MTKAATSSAANKTMLPPRDLKRSVTSTLLWAAMAGLLMWSWEGADLRPLDLIRDASNMGQFTAGFLQPNFHDWPTYLSEMIVTLQIAVWGTFLAVICAIPLSILCASNVVPWWVYQPVRRLMDAARAINELVFAMLFVVAVGLGPFAGVLALWVHNTGIIAKLFSEAVESVDPRPIEGIRATGASRLQEVIFGVIPQVLPLWTSYSLYRFETNVRSATVLGIVGAGGIGVILWEYIRGFYYAETAAVVLIIVVSVSIIDVASQRLRQMLL